MTGPTIEPKLINTLVGFRQHAICLEPIHQLRMSLFVSYTSFVTHLTIKTYAVITYLKTTEQTEMFLQIS